MKKKCIVRLGDPPEQDAEFAANIEDVLQTYAKPHDAAYPNI